MPLAFDAHTNFAYSTVLTAPSPALSGTTLTVQAGDGAKFPAAQFNIAVWPAGQLQTTLNCEICRVVSLATDTLTIQRTNEGSANRAIVVGDQVAAVASKRTFTDIEGGAGAFPAGHRLTLSGSTAVPTTDVTGATNIFLTPYTSSRIALFDAGGTPTLYFTSGDVSVAVPNTTNTMYDVFAFANGSVVTLETLAWTNDTTRATAVVRDTNLGSYFKSGDLTRRYMGSIRTTGTIGQSEDSLVKRYCWNYYNRVRRPLARFESTNNWAYTTATFRQANANTANQVEVVVGIQESVVDISLQVFFSNTNTGVIVYAGIGENTTATVTVNPSALTGGGSSQVANLLQGCQARLVKIPVNPGRTFYSWNEFSTATGATTWFANFASLVNAGLLGYVEA